MRSVFLFGILLLLLSPLPGLGAESYPALYRGELRASGPRQLAHFQKSFLNLKPAEQRARITKLEKELKERRLDRPLPPGLEAEGSLKALYSMIVDRLGQIYYFVSGAKLYPTRAIGFHLFEYPSSIEECFKKVSFVIETEWVTPGPPYEKSGPPPFLEANRDPNGALIFAGTPFGPIDELQQTPFPPIAFPEDLPEPLRNVFEEMNALEKRAPSFRFSAPRTGFLPLEFTVWSDQLPKNIALIFFYQKKGIWNEIPFPFDRPSDRIEARPISRFDLNRNGKKEYLVEDRLHRFIYEVDENSAETLLMASTTTDHLFIPTDTRRHCRE
jgi:hypothetical protein